MSVRRASFAGSFYTDDPADLSSQIDSFLKDAGEKKRNGVVGLVSPHAGYIYSGPVAAHAYAAVAGKKFDTVIVLAPSHRARFDGFCVMPSGSYETPLGEIPVNAELASKLAASPLAFFNRDVDALEHSREVQLPFLQKTVGSFSLVPVLVGTTDLTVCRRIAHDIHDALKGYEGTVLVVVSTDLSHYHPYDEAKRLDAKVSAALEKFDEKILSDLLAEGEAEACGEGPLVAGIALVKLMGASRCTVLHRANSGDTAGDKHRVVGYLAAAFTE